MDTCVLVVTKPYQGFLTKPIDRALVYIGESGKPVYAPYDPFMAAWFKYR